MNGLSNVLEKAAERWRVRGSMDNIAVEALLEANAFRIELEGALDEESNVIDTVVKRTSDAWPFGDREKFTEAHKRFTNAVHTLHYALLEAAASSEAFTDEAREELTKRLGASGT